MLPILFAAAAAVASPPASPPSSAAPPAPRPRDRDDDDDEGEGRVDAGGPLVVTGRRLDAARTSIDAALGATVYSLTNDAVENRPGGETGKVADILAQAPGVVPSGQGLAVRGSRAVEVRINGVVLPQAVRDPQEHLSARLAETTRLMTGTLPAQFGFAPGGVLDATTKSGLYQHGGQAELFVGTRGFIEPALEWAGSAEGTSLFASGSLERDRSVVSAAAGPDARDARRELGGLLFADRLIGAHDRVSLVLGGSAERHRIGATAIGAGTTRNSDGYAVGTFQHSDDGFTLQASLTGGLASDSAAFGSTSRERRSTVGTQIDASERLSDENTVRLGLLAQRLRTRELESSGTRSRAAQTSVAAYVEDEWKVAPGLTLDPGLRVEWLRGLARGAAVEPRAGIVWTPDAELTVHVGYARYAAAPPLGEATAARLPDQRDDYYDAGVQRKLGALTVGLDGYWREVRNLLATRETPGAAQSTTFAYRRARIRGIELSAVYARRGTTAWANLAVSEARGRSILGGQGLFPPATLAGAERAVPLAAERPVSASGGFTHRFDELTLSADILASSGAPRTLDAARPNGARAPAYALIGLAAVYRLKLAHHSTDLRLDVSNLTDVRAETSDARSLEGGWTRLTRGRALVLGIEQGF